MASCLSNEEEDQALILPRGGGRVEKGAIDVASSMNELVYGYCASVCFLGDCEKQIQFEVEEATTATYDPLTQLFKRLSNNEEEVQASRQLLFDEDSVVEEVSTRSGGDTL